jgi:hypothetical protein
MSLALSPLASIADRVRANSPESSQRSKPSREAKYLDLFVGARDEAEAAAAHARDLCIQLNEEMKSMGAIHEGDRLALEAHHVRLQGLASIGEAARAAQGAYEEARDLARAAAHKGIHLPGAEEYLKFDAPYVNPWFNADDPRSRHSRNL